MFRTCYDHRSVKTRVAAAALLCGLATPAAAADPLATSLIRQAITAQGGEAALRLAKVVEWKLEGYREMVEQSERPEGPYIPEFRSVREIDDFAHGAFASIADLRVYPEFKFSSGVVADATAAMRVVGTNFSAGNADMLAAARDSLALSPERLLLTALDAADLRGEPATLLQSTPQDKLRFSLRGSPVTLYLNRFTHLPTAIEYSGPAARDGYWRYFGDVTMRVYYSYWWLGDGGVRLPMQWDIYRNGLHDSSYMATKVSWNSAPDAELLQIPDEIRRKFTETADPAAVKLAAPVQIAPNVAFLPGAWNISFVRQADGIVILEAPISSAYSEQVLAAATKLYPGMSVKAVITTSDSWPHIAGIRAYVARGIPIYCLDLNVPILSRLAQAQFTTAPDQLQLHKREPKFIPVSRKVVIGSGASRIELYPIRGETSERQMMAYLPDLKLLYGSDPFQKTQNGVYRTTQAVSELLDAVKREGLQPARFFMMHVEPTDWSELSKAVTAANSKFPDGSLQ
jgi:hypothetical protein